jgi:CYTH domain-containing protein
MSAEIERKFLILKPPLDLDKFTPTKIIQGYLAITGDGVEIRLRKRDNAYVQTVKSGTGLERQEVETEITEGQFASLWPLTEGKRIEKTRYDIPYADGIIELDIYKGTLEGLVTAEVEFKSQEDAEAFSPPEWMGQEVTQDDGYKNKNLARYGQPSEEKPNTQKP